MIRSEEIRTVDGLAVPMPPSHSAPPALPAPIPVPLETDLKPWPDEPPALPAPIPVPLETDLEAWADEPVPPGSGPAGPPVVAPASRPASAHDRTPGTTIEPLRERPSRPGGGPRHRAPRRARRWRGKVLTLTVAGVAVGGVVITLSHDGSGHVARASADSSRTTGPPTRPLIGPGCGTKPESSAFPAMVGDGWTDVGGGPAQCGGHSLASQTTSGSTAVQDTYTWNFQTEKSARCMAQVFVSSADPSPGVAHYDVSSAEQPLASFTIDQARFKGRWVAAGPFTTFDGKLQIKLTDQPERAGARHHVNASAATIGCVS